MTGYCKYCGSLIENEDMIRLTRAHRLVWVGCYPCYQKRSELLKHAKENK